MTSSVDVILTGYERLENSRSGNPRFRLHGVYGMTWDTKSDASCNYDVENILGSTQLPARRRVEVRLHLTGGRVWNIERR